MKWRTLSPNAAGDWIKKGNAGFIEFIPLAPEKKFTDKDAFFKTYSLGVGSNRDNWVYNFSTSKIIENMQLSANAYKESQLNYVSLGQVPSQLDNALVKDLTRISWILASKEQLLKGVDQNIEQKYIRPSAYRPYTKQLLYYDPLWLNRTYQTTRFFPTPTSKNLLICVSGISGTKPFAALITDLIPCLDAIEKGQCFPLYYYEESKASAGSLFDGEVKQQYTRRDGISDYIYKQAQAAYGSAVTKEDIFYYVYGFLHSPSYRETFANDLRKSLPRLPLVDKPKDFWSFSKAGRALAELHIHYEQVPPMPGVVVTGAESGKFTVQKMRFGKGKDKTTIHYNDYITVSNIPLEAYAYVVNGRSAIEWIIDRYQIRTDKKSGITNDPNDWASEVGNPRYILDLLLSVINVSVQTVGIVGGLVEVEF